MTDAADIISCWILAPSAHTGPMARPMFPDSGHQRPDFRARAGRPLHTPDSGFMDMPGDEVPDSPDMLVLERETAQRFFHRMGLALRVARGEGSREGHFSNGILDPASIAKALHLHTGFSIPLVEVEGPLIPFVRWLKPDINRDRLRQADYQLGRQMLALLREARHAGGVSLLFLPQDVDNPRVLDHG